MVGLGEREDELIAVLEDLHQRQVDVVTIGQYLRPSARHIPVVRYYPPAEFDSLKQAAREIGLPQVEAGPLVRSSYHAHEHLHRSLD
jgi:lipoic acid synthetase